jgi:pimeloyl-ACP methyl ester carboxylesterase
MTSGTYEIHGARQHYVDTHGIRLSVYEAGERSNPTVVFSHGFPELAYSWRHQVAALAQAGFHVVAPDQRGYGASDKPLAVEAYDMVHLTGDLVGLLDAMDVDRAVFVGHDWGGFVVWQMPFHHPGRVAGVVGVNTPHTVRFPVPPVEMFRNVFGEHFYIVWFQSVDGPEAELEANVDVVLDHMLRRGIDPAAIQERAASASRSTQTFVETVVDLPPEMLGSPLLTDEQLAVYAEAFRAGGFRGPVNWYRNFDRNWEMSAGRESDRIDGVPCLMVTAAWDPVLPPALAQGMPDLIEDLEIHEISECGHWTQQERPDELNGILIDWLQRTQSRSGW